MGSRSDVTRRAKELRESYTATELAAMLAHTEAVSEGWMGRARRAEETLRSIARGDWTAEGAVHVASAAMDRVTT